MKAGATYYFSRRFDGRAPGNNATSNNSGSLYAFVAVATPVVLLIDDYDDAGEMEAGSPVIDAGTYTNALAAAGFSFAYWKVIDRGPPQLSDLQPFHVVMWRTTDDIINYTGTNNTLTSDQQSMIQTYLNNGGSFFMASMGILSQLGDVPFRANVLQVGGFVQNPDPPAPCDCDEYFGVPSFTGVPGDPITGGMNVTLNYSQYYPSIRFGLGEGDVFGPDFGDTFTMTTNSTAIAFEPVSGKCCGARFPATGVNSPGRVGVFARFPLDAVPESVPRPITKQRCCCNVLNFLDPGGNGIGTVTLAQRAGGYDPGAGDGASRRCHHRRRRSNPGDVLQQFIHQSSRGNVERDRPCGPLQRISPRWSATNTAVPAQLRVRNGDTLTASYFDAAISNSVLATASVDTNPPVISGVTAATNVGNAVITWNTSEPADSLVQYGGGTILDHSAYNGQLVTGHSVTLSQLLANHVYYFQVVSRDVAGNTATDDNQGALYNFTTPKTLQPPWFDNLETGAKNWTVVL